MILSFSVLRRHCLATAIVVVAMVVVWWALWELAAAQYRQVIDGWIDTQRAAGYHVDYDDRQLFGFPRHVVFRFTNLRWKNTDDILFHADQMDLTARPWQWQLFDARFKNHVEITAPLDDSNYALILGGENGHAHVELDQQGFWKLSRISLEKAHLGRTPDYVFLADWLEASAARPENPPKDHKEIGLTLTGEAKNITLPVTMSSPFGSTMAKLKTDLRVMGDVPDFRKKESVDVWNKDSGVVEFDHFTMEWGPLAMAAKGTIGFDDDLQPEGAFASVISDQQVVLKALMQHGFIAQNQGEMLDSALHLFAKPSRLGDSKPGIEVPIAVQLGGLFLGPVKILSFPEIEWPPAGP